MVHGEDRLAGHAPASEATDDPLARDSATARVLKPPDCRELVSAQSLTAPSASICNGLALSR